MFFVISLLNKCGDASLVGSYLGVGFFFLLEHFVYLIALEIEIYFWMICLQFHGFDFNKMKNYVSRDSGESVDYKNTRE